MSGPRPPALARLLLRAFLPDPPGRDLRADLEEEYAKRIRPERGRWSADLWYWRQALASVVPIWRRRLEAGWGRWWEPGGGIAGWRADLRSAARRLRRAPAFAGLVVLTLAVGIGANAAIFSVLRGVLIRPLPYPEADRLVHLWETNPEVDDELHGPSPLNFADWERSVGSFESMAAWYLTSGTYRTEGWAEELRSAQVTADFFRVLGVRPALGRDFRREEVVGYGPVMLSHGVWRRLFGGDPSVVGSTVVSSGSTYEVVGVMPPGFAFPDESVETWVAWDLPSVYADRPEARTWRFLEGLGRLAPGTSAARAAEELDAVAASLAEAHPDANGGWSVALTSLRDDLVGDARAALWLSFGAVVLILVVACANVANLLLARVPARSRELAVRASLGASRGRIVRGLLTESLLMAAVAGLLGLALGALLLRVLVAVDAGRIPRLEEVSIDGWVLAFTVAVSALTSVAFGLAPALHAVRGSAAASLRSGRRAIGGASQRRLREGFVASQVAVAVVLLAGAGLFRASFQRVLAVDPGFDPENVVTFRVSLDPTGGGARETARYYDGLLERIEALPGVVRAGAVQTLPINPVGNDFRRPYRPAGSALESADAPTAQMRIVTDGYLEAMGMRLVEGDGLPATASAGEPLVAMVNRTLAERLRPGGGAVGRVVEVDFREGWQPYTITGVVEDVRHYGPRESVRPELYVSHRQVPYLAMSVAARTGVAPETLVEPLRAAVRAHRPMQPAHAFVTMGTLRGETVAEERFLLVLLATFSAVAFLLAASGVYGVIAYTVSRRRREIGVRMAFGARGPALVGRVVGRAAAVALVGLAIGLAVVVAVSGVLEALLFGVSPTDPGTLARVGAIVLGVGVVAAYLPARRAGRISPAEALRVD